MLLDDGPIGTKCTEAVLCWMGQVEEVEGCKIYIAMELQHLYYRATVWQECMKNLRKKLERVRNYCMRITLSQNTN